MAKKIILSQRTNRHVVKKLDDSYNYLNSFGTWDTIKTNNTGLNFPAGIAADASNNIYVCDSKNSRIVKLNSSLVFVSSLDVTTIIGKPLSILFDSTTSDLYVVGIYNNFQVSIARITTALGVLKSAHKIYQDYEDKVYGISRGFSANEFLITLGNTILSIIEDGDSFIAGVAITNETIVTTSNDALENRINFALTHQSIVASSYVFLRTWTEEPTKITTTTFQTSKLPVLGTPDIDFKVFKNTVELDFNPLLNTLNDYNINQNTGLITLSKAVILTDVIKIRYKFQMTKTTDYTLNEYNGMLRLNKPVSKDVLYLADLINTDVLVLNYSYINTANSKITIIGEEYSYFTGIVKHATLGLVVLAVVKDNVAKLSYINSSYINVGDSNKISKSIVGLCQCADGSILTYDNQNQKIVRYNIYLNKAEDVYTDKTDLIETDAYDVCGIVELPI
jgi:hypothetical protein